METAHVILGAVVTEKSERLKSQRVYTLTVRQDANKIDVMRALKKHYDVDAASVRVMRTTPKTRLIAAGRSIVKRHRTKKVLVTLTPKSNTLDLTAFRTS